MAGPAVLGVQLGGRRPDWEEVSETYRRLHVQKPVQDHSLQRLQGNRRGKQKLQMQPRVQLLPDDNMVSLYYRFVLLQLVD